MTIYVIFAILFAWLTTISLILYKTRRHYHNLTTRTKKDRIDDILEELLLHDKKFSTEIDRISKELKETIENSNIPIQKIGMVRFNPFERAGGEQSFVLAFLNNRNSGIVINFIYTREGLRTYIKKIKGGKGEKYDLSEEEEEAVKKSVYY